MIPAGLWTLLVTVVGLLAGSFISAWSWRLHTEESIVKGRSACPQCQHALSVRDLVPLFSWLLQRGKCRHCREPISRRYPIIEAVTASLFLLSYLSWRPDSPLAIAGFSVWLIILISLLTIAVFDLEWMLIPMQPLYLAAGLAAVYLGIKAAAGLPPADWLVSPGLAAVLAGSGFWLLSRLSGERWMGEGDAYLAALMGLLLGLGRTALGLFLAFNAAAIISVGLILLGRKTRKDLVPFGPFLIMATIIAFLVGADILAWYQTTFLPPLV